MYFHEWFIQLLSSCGEVGGLIPGVVGGSITFKITGDAYQWEKHSTIHAYKKNTPLNLSDNIARTMN